MLGDFLLSELHWARVQKVAGQGVCSAISRVEAASCSVSSTALVNPILAELLGTSLLRTSQLKKIKLNLQLQLLVKAERGVLGCEQSKGTTLPKLKIKQDHKIFFFSVAIKTDSWNQTNLGKAKEKK